MLIKIGSEDPLSVTKVNRPGFVEEINLWEEMFMPRIPRLVIKGPNVAYHIVSRTALDGFVLGPEEKDHLLSLIRWLSSVFFRRGLWVLHYG